MLNDFGYLEQIEANLRRVKEEQAANIQAAGKLMADAVEQDRLISVYGGGGHTTLVMGEMFFRAGGLANINPVMETGLSVFNQALKYLELERTENYGSAIMRYYDLQPGDLLIIPPAIMHHPIFRDFEIPYERYVLWLSPPAFDTMKKIDPDIDYFLRPGHAKTFLIRDSVDSSRARFGQFEALTHAYREESLCYHSEGMADILRILIGINRSLYNREHVFAKAQKPSVLSNALHYIDLNLSGDLSLDTVAKALFIDKYNFSHMFKQNMQISFYQYVIQQRLLEAKRLLMKKEPISSIPAKCGFSDYNAFYRSFKKNYGVNPREYVAYHIKAIHGEVGGLSLDIDHQSTES